MTTYNLPSTKAETVETPESSNIRRFSWAPPADLLVTFQSGDKYLYSGNVSHDLFLQFKSASSKGGFFARHIRKLACTRIDLPAPAEEVPSV